jgi:hypothetical protein
VRRGDTANAAASLEEGSFYGDDNDEEAYSPSPTSDRRALKNKGAKSSSQSGVRVVKENTIVDVFY